MNMKELKELEGKVVQTVSLHRNGVGGEPFYTGFVYDPELDKTLMFVHFPDYNDEGEVVKGDSIRTAVLCQQLAAEGEVSFGTNSWRGDHYHDVIVAEIIRKNRGARIK